MPCTEELQGPGDATKAVDGGSEPLQRQDSQSQRDNHAGHQNENAGGPFSVKGRKKHNDPDGKPHEGPGNRTDNRTAFRSIFMPASLSHAAAAIRRMAAWDCSTNRRCSPRVMG